MARAIGALAAGSLLVAGCWLPVGTAAPQSATTVGQGELGFTVHGEAPTIDLLATQTDEDTDPNQYALMPWPTFGLQLAYGLRESFDIELSIDGTFLIVLPIPYGASAGGRLQLLHSKSLAVAFAGKVGYLGSESDDGEVSATYGAATLTGQLRNLGPIRPGLALTAMPASVLNEVVEDARERFWAFAGSATGTLTVAAGSFEIGPFVNIAYFRSPNLRGASSFATVGLILGYRSQKDPPDVMVPAGPYRAPGEF